MRNLSSASAPKHLGAVRPVSEAFSPQQTGGVIVPWCVNVCRHVATCLETEQLKITNVCYLTAHPTVRVQEQLSWVVLVPGPVRARSGRQQGLRHLRTPPRLRAGWHAPRPRPSQRAPGPLPGPLRSFPDLQSATPSLLVTCRWPQKPPPCGGTANHLQSCPHTRAQLVCRSRTAFAVAIRV